MTSDGTYSTAQTGTWTVANPITILSVPEVSFNASQAFSLQVQTGYTGTGILHYTATGLPTGVTINASTGSISGKLETGPAVRGNYVGTVWVTDGTYVASETVTLTALGNPIGVAAMVQAATLLLFNSKPAEQGTGISFAAGGPRIIYGTGEKFLFDTVGKQFQGNQALYWHAYQSILAANVANFEKIKKMADKDNQSLDGIGYVQGVAIGSDKQSGFAAPRIGVTKKAISYVTVDFGVLLPFQTAKAKAPVQLRIQESAAQYRFDNELKKWVRVKNRGTFGEFNYTTREKFVVRPLDLTGKNGKEVMKGDNVVEGTLADPAGTRVVAYMDEPLMLYPTDIDSFRIVQQTATLIENAGTPNVTSVSFQFTFVLAVIKGKPSFSYYEGAAGEFLGRFLTQEPMALQP